MKRVMSKLWVGLALVTSALCLAGAVVLATLLIAGLWRADDWEFSSGLEGASSRQNCWTVFVGSNRGGLAVGINRAMVVASTAARPREWRWTSSPRSATAYPDWATPAPVNWSGWGFQVRFDRSDPIYRDWDFVVPEPVL